MKKRIMMFVAWLKNIFTRHGKTVKETVTADGVVMNTLSKIIKVEHYPVRFSCGCKAKVRSLTLSEYKIRQETKETILPYPCKRCRKNK